MSSGADLILYVAALVFPPFPVVVKRGCDFQLLLNLILVCFGWIPGILHAWYIIAATKSPRHHHVTHHSNSNYPQSTSWKHSHHSGHSQHDASEMPPKKDYYAQPPSVQGGYGYGAAPVHAGYAHQHQDLPPKY